MLYMLLAGSKDVVAWPGVENATGNVYATTHGAQVHKDPSRCCGFLK